MMDQTNYNVGMMSKIAAGSSIAACIMGVLLTSQPSIVLTPFFASCSLVSALLIATAQLILLTIGSTSIFLILRFYQLEYEREVTRQQAIAQRYYRRYRSSKKVAKRPSGKQVPIPAYIHSTFDLEPPLNDAISTFVSQLTTDYIDYWFLPLSHGNPEFSNDVKLVLAEVFSSLVRTICMQESDFVLQFITRALELLQLHLGWFRETYEKLSESHPELFAAEQTEENLTQRQRLVATYAQDAQFLHPGCTSKTIETDPSEEIPESQQKYLRHVSRQLLEQLAPKLRQNRGQFSDMASHLLQEVVAFQVLQPLAEYTQPKYANQLVVDIVHAYFPPTVQETTNVQTNLMSSSYQLTKSFLYKASKRGLNTVYVDNSLPSGVDSSNELELDDGVMLSSPDSGSCGRSSDLMDNYDDEEYGQVDSPTANVKRPSKESMSRLKAASVDDSRPLSAQKAGRFIMTPMHNSMALGVKASSQAARMMKRPGMFLSNALKRGSGNDSHGQYVDESDGPPLSALLAIEAFVDNSNGPPPFVKDERDKPTVPTPQPEPSTSSELQDRVLSTLGKAVDEYVHMYENKVELRTSPRTKELYALLSALEDLLLLGFRAPTSEDGSMSPKRPPEDLFGEMEVENPTPSVSYWRFLSAERPSSQILNAHSSFVDAKCPPCATSEVFVCVRGIQWLLVALERGRLAELFAELPSDETICERYYMPELSIWQVSDRCKTVVESLSKLSTLRVMLDIPTALGRPKKAFVESESNSFSVDNLITRTTRARTRTNSGNSISSAASSNFTNMHSTSSGVSSSSNGQDQHAYRVVDSVAEVDRYVPIQGWAFMGLKTYPTLPTSEWVWETEWTLETDDDSADSSGYEYAKAADDKYHPPPVTKKDMFRRRKWLRRRRLLPLVLTPAPSTSVPESPNGSSNLMASSMRNGWNRAKNLNLKTRFTSLSTDLDTSSPKSSGKKSFDKNSKMEKEPQSPPSGSKGVGTPKSVGGNFKFVPSLKLGDRNVMQKMRSTMSTPSMISSGQSVSSDVLSPGKKDEEEPFVSDDEDGVENVVDIHVTCTNAHDEMTLDDMMLEVDVNVQEDMLEKQVEPLYMSYMLEKTFEDFMRLEVDVVNLSYKPEMDTMLQEMDTIPSSCWPSNVQNSDLDLADVPAMLTQLLAFMVQHCPHLKSSSAFQHFVRSGQKLVEDPSSLTTPTNKRSKWRSFNMKAPSISAPSVRMAAKPRRVQELEVSLVSTLNELFELDGIGLVRRQLFSMLRSFIRAFLSASHVRTLEKQWAHMLLPAQAAEIIESLRTAVVATEKSPEVNPKEAREASIQALLQCVPSALSSLFGEGTCDNGALKLHEMLQHEVFVKNLGFTLLDELLSSLFPQMEQYTKEN